MLSITKAAPSVIKYNSNLKTLKSNIQNTQAVSFTGEAKMPGKIVPVPEDKIFGENHSLNPVIKNWLDKREFIFDTQDGTQLASIRDMIAQSEHREMQNLGITAYKGCFVEEEIDDIKENGFDPSCIKRTKFGPGFYFASSEGEAREYGSAVLKAKVEGNCWYILDSKWYNKLTSSSSPVCRSIADFTGAKDYETAKSILDEYVRDLMCNELEADFAFCAGNIVCFNPDSISSVESA